MSKKTEGLHPHSEPPLLIDWGNETPLLDGVRGDRTKADRTLRTHHVIAILRRYIRGNLSELDVERWASFVTECPAMIYEPEDQAAIAEVLCKLANPLSSFTLDRARAISLICDLSNY